MKIPRRGIWIGLIVGLVILFSLSACWWRSLRVDDAVQWVASDSARFNIYSHNGSICTSAAVGIPVPKVFFTGIFQIPIKPTTERTPLGKFHASYKPGRGLALIFPYWLVILPTAVLFGGLLFHRKSRFGFSQYDSSLRKT